MKVTFTTHDRLEINRLTKAEDMASALFEIVHNAWRQFDNHYNPDDPEDSGYDWGPAWDAIHKVLEEHNINIDELIE